MTPSSSSLKLRVHSLVLLVALAGLFWSAECKGVRSTDEESSEDFEAEDAHASKDADEHLRMGTAPGSSGEGPSGSLWSSVSDGIANMAAKNPLMPRVPRPPKEPEAKSALGKLLGAGDSPAKTDSKPDAGKEVQVADRSLSDWLQLILNPLELTKAISVHFKLSQERLVEKLGKGLVFGLEAMLHPLVVTLKIVEKVFVPDACRLKLICQMGSHLELIRSTVLKLSPSLLEGSSQLLAFSEGISGKDCSSAFASCEPKLRKPFEELKANEGPDSKSYSRSAGAAKTA